MIFQGFPGGTQVEGTHSFLVQCDIGLPSMWEYVCETALTTYLLSGMMGLPGSVQFGCFLGLLHVFGIAGLSFYSWHGMALRFWR